MSCRAHPTCLEGEQGAKEGKMLSFDLHPELYIKIFNFLCRMAVDSRMGDFTAQRSPGNVSEERHLALCFREVAAWEALTCSKQAQVKRKSE